VYDALGVEPQAPPKSRGRTCFGSGALRPPPPVVAPLVPRYALLPAATPRLTTLRVRFGRPVTTIAFALVTVGIVACGGPAAQPAPSATAMVAARSATAAPTPARATAPGQPTVEATAQSSDVENAYLSNVDDLIAEAADLTVTPCDELTAVTKANPNLVPSVRGFATALKRAGASQPALDTDAVRASLADLDHSMGQFEGALSLCGIK